MPIPAYETLETARVFHSFSERGSLYFLSIVVGFELAELYLEHVDWKWQWSPYGKLRTLLSLQSIVKIAGVVFFGVAMALEYASIEYSDSVDRLSDDATTYAQRQTRAALIVAGKANEASAAAQERAAQLLAVIQPRNLTIEQQAGIAVALKKFSGYKLQISSPPSNPEAYPLCKQLAASLLKAGILLNPEMCGRLGGSEVPPWTGVLIGGKEPPDRAFEKAFTEAVKDASKGKIIPRHVPDKAADFPQLIVAVKPFDVVSAQKQAEDTEAARLLQSTKLQDEVRGAISRSSLLLDPSSQKLLATLDKFSGQKVQIGRCGIGDHEIAMTALTISGLLSFGYHWQVVDPPPPTACSTGMLSIVRYDAPEHVRRAAEELGRVLIKIGLIPKGAPPVVVTEKHNDGSTEAWEPTAADTVLLMVLIHP